MRYNVLTIEREFGSGGREVGRLVGEKLKIPCYNREILKMAAAQYDTSPEYLEHLEETATNSFLYSLYMLSSDASMKGGELSGSDQLYLAETNIIKSLAAQGSCVMVGRCAGHVLAERNDVLTAFIRADFDERVHRATEVYGLDPNKVGAAIRKTDKRRGDYYHANTGVKWASNANYHIVLDSGKLGLTACADILTAAMR